MPDTPEGRTLLPQHGAQHILVLPVQGAGGGNQVLLSWEAQGPLPSTLLVGTWLPLLNYCSCLSALLRPLLSWKT